MLSRMPNGQLKRTTWCQRQNGLRRGTVLTTMCGMVIGTLAEWVAGLATAATLIHLVVDSRKIKYEQRDAEKSRYARLVSSRVVGGGHAPIPEATGAGDERTSTMPDFVYVENASATAICDVVVAVCNASEELTASGMAKAFTSFVPVIPPGRYRFKTPWSYEATKYPPSAALIFRDAQGLNWVKTNHGRLRLIRGADKFLGGVKAPDDSTPIERIT